MRFSTRVVLAALALASDVATGQATTRKAATGQALPVSAESYRAAWSNIASCEGFRRKLWLLPQADDLLQAAASSKIAVKSEFESEAQYQERIERELSPFVQASSVYLVHSLKGDWSSYDAESKTMTVRFPSYTQSGYIPVGFDIASRISKGATYKGTNAFGVTKTVQRQTRITTQVDYTFPATTTGRPITFSMSGEDAKLFKAGLGSMHILGRIVSTNIRRGTTTPSLDRPNETSYTQYEITMQPRCAYITFGPELIGSWGYDAW